MALRWLGTSASIGDTSAPVGHPDDDALWLLMGQECIIRDPADSLGVGDGVDFDDLALGDSEAHNVHGPSTFNDDHAGRSVDQGWA